MLYWVCEHLVKGRSDTNPQETACYEVGLRRTQGRAGTAGDGVFNAWGGLRSMVQGGTQEGVPLKTWYGGTWGET